MRKAIGLGGIIFLVAMAVLLPLRYLTSHEASDQAVSQPSTTSTTSEEEPEAEGRGGDPRCGGRARRRSAAQRCRQRSFPRMGRRERRWDRQHLGADRRRRSGFAIRLRDVQRLHRHQGLQHMSIHPDDRSGIVQRGRHVRARGAGLWRRLPARLVAVRPGVGGVRPTGNVYAVLDERVQDRVLQVHQPRSRPGRPQPWSRASSARTSHGWGSRRTERTYTSRSPRARAGISMRPIHTTVGRPSRRRR